MATTLWDRGIAVLEAGLWRYANGCSPWHRSGHCELFTTLSQTYSTHSSPMQDTDPLCKGWAIVGMHMFLPIFKVSLQLWILEYFTNPGFFVCIYSQSREWLGYFKLHFNTHACAAVLACGHGQTAQTDTRDHYTFRVVYDSRDM